MVPTTPSTNSKESSSSSKDTQSIERSKSGKLSFNRKRKLASPATDSFRENLSSDGISKESAPLFK